MFLRMFRLLMRAPRRRNTRLTGAPRKRLIKGSLRIALFHLCA
jgi:hypothetical protein